jgi:hypothetical protein
MGGSSEDTRLDVLIQRACIADYCQHVREDEDDWVEERNEPPGNIIQLDRNYYVNSKDNTRVMPLTQLSQKSHEQNSM